MSDDLDAICAEYMARLKAALSGLPSGDRTQIVEQVSEHIASARAALPEQTEAGVREILERLGQPEEIASEAKTETGSSKRRARTPVLFAAALAVVLVGVGIGIPAALGAFSSAEGPAKSNVIQPPNNSTSQAADANVSVPEVTGEQLNLAVQALASSGLAYKVSYSPGIQPVGTVPIGTVIVQRPSAGTMVQGASVITLTVVGTANSVTVPNLAGQSQAQAQSTLASAGLIMTVNGPVASTNVARGVVISQSPAAGAAVPPRSSVAVTVSAGPS
jgi:hypothetical protein